VTVVRRPAAIALCCGVLTGCGGGDDRPVQLPKAKPAGGLVFRGSTSQRQPLRIDAGDRLLAKFKLLLRCKDGGETQATVATEPERPALQSDGSFYYSETGRATFRGFGPGRYRAAMAGRLQGERGEGRASFRISFRSTACRAAVRWRVRRV
jgi:hypothetical protein